MKQEDKELLLRDLCARLPYGVKLKCASYKMICIGPYKLDTIVLDRIFNENTEYVPFDEFKPYLFPLSSMTKEQRKELRKIMDYVEATFMNACCKGGFTLSFTNLTDWLNANHFDYRGLIPKGLAIDATGLGVYENNA